VYDQKSSQIPNEKGNFEDLNADPGTSAEVEDAELDPLYNDVVTFVLRSHRASISGVQRHFRIGYNRAARLIEEMERSGLVSPMQPNGNREVLDSSPPSNEPDEINLTGSENSKTHHRKWRKWGLAYLIWVVGYLVFANKFLNASSLNSSPEIKSIPIAHSETGAAIRVNPEVALRESPLLNPRTPEKTEQVVPPNTTDISQSVSGDSNGTPSAEPKLESTATKNIQAGTDENGYVAKFKGAFGKVVERRSYPTEEMRQQALDLWHRELKILEPDGSINDKYVPKKQGFCPIPGNC
jgi:hypothetical protein